MNLIIVSIAEGLLWAVMAIGIFLSFRILQIADLTIEGAFPLGAAVSAAMIAGGFNPLLATLMGFVAGMLAGLVTGLLINKLNIPTLLAGILTMTGLYSINLRIMGQANISLLNQDRFTQILDKVFKLPSQTNLILLASLILSVIVAGLHLFFKTDLGQALVATGDNERMAASMGVKVQQMKILALMLSNGFVALSGSLIAQNNGYADISMGIGTIVIGLASLMLAEVIYANVSLGVRLTSLAVGSIIYRLLISLALSLGLQPNDLKLVSAILLAFVIALPHFFKHYQSNLKAMKEGDNDWAITPLIQY